MLGGGRRRCWKEVGGREWYKPMVLRSQGPKVGYDYFKVELDS